MEIVLIGPSGEKIDARIEVENETIILHSRGGAKNKPNLRNLEYKSALRRIIEKLRAESVEISEVFLDSALARQWPLDERRLVDRADLQLPIERLITLLGARGAEKGRENNSAVGGNRTKRLRFVVPGKSSDQIIGILNGEAAGVKLRQPADMLRRVTPEIVEKAVQSLLDGAHHAFGASTDYDMILPSGERLSPKAVFGIALSSIIGRPAAPEEFSCGRGTLCFEILEGAGFPIIDKAEAIEYSLADIDDEKVWAEGAQKRVTHLRRERTPYLARTKKRQFEKIHGYLFCERCKIVPSRDLGPHGDACIEVHHSSVAVSKMDGSRGTRLSDLQCLCANCHRIVHREQFD